jgi:hypothetical protein
MRILRFSVLILFESLPKILSGAVFQDHTNDLQSAQIGFFNTVKKSNEIVVFIAVRSNPFPMDGLVCNEKNKFSHC